MKTLNKVQLAKKATLYTSLDEKLDALRTAVAEYNEAIETHAANINTALNEYNAAQAEAQEFIDAIRGSMEDYQEARSLQWQEGEAGQSFGAWVNAWEMSLDDMEVSEPEQLDEPDDELLREFENLPVRLSDV